MRNKHKKPLYICCCICEKGVPIQNDDCILIDDKIITGGEAQMNLHGNFFVAVADGVSNSQNGALASKTTLELLRQANAFSQKRLKKLIYAIHEKVIAISKKDNCHVDMQTTLCALQIARRSVPHYVNIGDSRLYHFKSNRLKQISKDQSFVEMLYDNGKISHEQKRIHRSRNLVLAAVGAENGDFEPEIGEISGDFELGDILMLCTDGLTDYVYDADIEATLALPLPPLQRLHRLCETALKNGSQDNISIAMLIRVQ